MTIQIVGRGSEAEYKSFLVEFQQNFDAIVGAAPVFTTNTSLLWETFIENIDEDQRQYYNCHACRDFINAYGGLVVINNEGYVVPVLWQVPCNEEQLHEAFLELSTRVSKHSVTGVFLSDKKVIGKPETGCWNHMALTLPDHLVNKDHIKTAHQRMADYKTDFQTLIASLREYPKEIATQALALVNAEDLARSAKFLKNAQWFVDLHNKLSDKNEKSRRNLIWREVATASVGLAHFKNTVLGSLMDDIKNGYSYDQLKRRWGSKVDTTQYMRPQEAPTDSNIDQAEKIIEKLNLTSALRRRLARPDELEYIWTPTVKERTEQQGVFDHLRKQNQELQSITVAKRKMTWIRLLNEILPKATEIEVYVNYRDNFVSFVTAVDPEAEPIIVWDSKELRNPVSWYVYDGGSSASQFNLINGNWAKVLGISYIPEMWHNNTPTVFEPSVAFILEGARDSKFDKCGLGLFPELLKRSLYDVRRTIEAFSRKGTLEGDNLNAAAGVLLHKGQEYNTQCRLTIDGVTSIYHLDR